MAILKIYKYPAKILEQKADPVVFFDEALVELCANMCETMFSAGGIGLAAPQVGISSRIIVVDSDQCGEPIVMVNPEIVWRSSSVQLGSEGCLSIPGIYYEVNRFESVRIKYQTPQGESRAMICDGLLSVCVQHEIDHLDGILYIDHLDDLNREEAVAAFLSSEGSAV